MVSFLTEQTVAEDSHGDGLVAALGVGFVDLDFLFELNSVMHLGSVLCGEFLGHLD